MKKLLAFAVFICSLSFSSVAHAACSTYPYKSNYYDGGGWVNFNDNTRAQQLIVSRQAEDILYIDENGDGYLFTNDTYFSCSKPRLTVQSSGSRGLFISGQYNHLGTQSIKDKRLDLANKLNSWMDSNPVVVPTTTTTTTTTIPPTTTTVRPTTTTSTTTVATGSPSLVSDSLSKSSMVLQSNINSNSVYWTVRVQDPFGGRLTSATVGARLCPTTASWPDGPGCTGATSTGQGNSLDRTYTFLFLISSDAPMGQWLGRIFGPVSGQPDIIGLSRITVTAQNTTTTIPPTTTTITTTTIPQTTTTVAPTTTTTTVPRTTTTTTTTIAAPVVQQQAPAKPIAPAAPVPAQPAKPQAPAAPVKPIVPAAPVLPATPVPAQPQVPTATLPKVQAPAIPFKSQWAYVTKRILQTIPSNIKTGAICKNGSTANTTHPLTCLKQGGVKKWIYSPSKKIYVNKKHICYLNKSTNKYTKNCKLA